MIKHNHSEKPNPRKAKQKSIISDVNNALTVADLKKVILRMLQE